MKLLLLFKTKTKAKPCISADAVTAVLKLHLVTWIYYYTVLGLTETEVPLAQWYQCQKMLTYQAARSRSLASENILICKQNQSWLTKFWAVPKEHSICSISGWAWARCFASGLSKNIIYPHHFLLHSCHAGKADFLQCMAQQCTMCTTTILCFL